MPTSGCAKIIHMELTTYYKCACANCGEVIDYTSAQAGQVIACPKCKEQSRLPEPDKLMLVGLSGPPTPEFKNCAVCGAQMPFFEPLCAPCEAARKRKLLLLWLTISASLLVLLAIGGWFLRQHIKARDAAAAAAAPRILLAQPRPQMPKSINDLRAVRFTLEKKRGSDLVLAVGDVENVSDNLHTHLQADVDLLDKTGAKIGTVSDYSTELGAHQTWHIVATVTQTNAMSVRFAGIKEEQ